MDKLTLPKEVKTRVGAKVCWNAYSSLADAEIASKHARKEAIRLMGLGYDFGWLFPGDFTREPDADGLFWVTFP